MEAWSRRARGPVIAVVVAAGAWTIVQGAVYPDNPMDLGPQKWAALAFRNERAPIEFAAGDALAARVPANTRILTDSAYLHAAFLPKGIEVVAVWSPEVSFLFTATPDEAHRKLHELGIDVVALYPASVNTKYLLSKSPFYAAIRSMRFEVLANYENVVALLKFAPPA